MLSFSYFITSHQHTVTIQQFEANMYTTQTHTPTYTHTQLAPTLYRIQIKLNNSLLYSVYNLFSGKAYISTFHDVHVWFPELSKVFPLAFSNVS